MTKAVTLGSETIKQAIIGGESNFTVIAGPCVIENRDLCMKIAEFLTTLCERLQIGYLFKASFDKANRSSGASFRGPGLEEGLKILSDIRQRFNVPIVTDIHWPEQAQPCGQVVDVLQIPAFLSRQTDLVQAAGRTGKCVQVKKAQFAAPWDMTNIINKIKETGNDNIILVERGTSFGYNRLVCDMTGIEVMRRTGYPVVMDATHSTQQPGGLGNASGGAPDMAGILALAAVAAGADGLFIETHPQPQNALSDAACMLPMDQMENLLKKCRDCYFLVRQ